MARTSFTRRLVAQRITVGLTLLLLCYVLPAGQSHAEDPAEAEKPAPPIMVAPEVLAQAVQDDVNAAARKYHLTQLQLTGVVTKQSAYKGEVNGFQFDVTIKDRKTDKPEEFSIFFGLKDPLPKGDKRIEAFAAGKKVTVRGKSIAMGNGQVTLLYCVLVPEDAKQDDGGK